jgi:hypothetical protein
MNKLKFWISIPFLCWVFVFCFFSFLPLIFHTSKIFHLYWTTSMFLSSTKFHHVTCGVKRTIWHLISSQNLLLSLWNVNQKIQLFPHYLEISQIRDYKSWQLLINDHISTWKSTWTFSANVQKHTQLKKFQSHERDRKERNKDFCNLFYTNRWIIMQ